MTVPGVGRATAPVIGRATVPGVGRAPAPVADGLDPGVSLDACGYSRFFLRPLAAPPLEPPKTILNPIT